MNYPYNNVFLDVAKFSLDKGDLTGYYIHNGKSVRLQTLFSKAFKLYLNSTCQSWDNIVLYSP
ncbi:MAG: hypothetical protein EWV58_04335 [Microcystis aeruginosa Ma_MB_F_20061100_S19]|nr:MAG: hypothetical protein EWV59_02045 [Microcystis aeruginosa Ma_MB_F_20061100_S19D]TRU17595.1 MAG: hypothetical protein EWV58_04335 [Microcystis aeruginosa Ma_MB_F_20061100_S19]